MSRKKKITISLIALAVVVLSISFFLYRTDFLAIVPYSSSASIAINTYHEEGPVFSTTHCERTDTGIVFQYTLNSAFLEPFAAVYLRDTSEQHPLFDASKYDMLELHLFSEKGTRLPITFSIKKKMIIGKDTIYSVPYSVVIDHSGKPTTYKIMLSHFKVPSWWLRYYKLSESQFEKPDLSHIGNFVVGSCQALGPEIPDTIQISAIRFIPSNRTLLWTSGSVLFLLLVTGIVINLRKKPSVNNSLQIEYTPLPLADKQTDEFGRIVEFISKNYPNAELSLSDVQNGVGMNGKAISKLIKTHLQISFTDYLNQLRITEVKRLLKETKLPISDIAYKVGYNNISHFNRVFKSITGTTPKNYRED